MAGLSLKSALVAALAAVSSAMPAAPRLTPRQMKIHEIMKRQSAAEMALGITDLDVLQFALTLENLETAFYQQGFAKFPMDQFAALGLDQAQLGDLMNIGASESAHVQILQSTLAQKGVKPVAPCQYNFQAALASPQAMVQTASVLEQVGVSAYLGAATILADPTVLGAAASIYSVEARHQTFIRSVSKIAAAPDFFDTPLTPKRVFTLAAPFIASCPEGSNLALTANPNITMTDAGLKVTAAGGQSLALQSTGAAQAKACAFSSGNFPTGTMFTAFTNGACVTPQGMTGTVYLDLVNAIPADGKITDALVTAGPMVLAVS